MKQWILSAGALLLFAFNAGAQAKKTTKKKHAPAASTEQVRLESSSANEARAPFRLHGNSGTSSLSIADPKINYYNGRASGLIPDDEVDRPIIGIPKLRYGVAHGHLLFYNTTAPISGANTGSGSVGTGTSTGNVGINGVAPGVNGKAPYSGPGIYGNRVQLSGAPVNLPPTQPRDRDNPDQKP